MNAMKTKLIIGTAALAVMQLYAVPTAARRAEAVAEATKIYEQLTPDETVQMAMMDNPEIKRLGLPRFHWWSEALHGYARAGLATVFPQAIGTGATFDPDLEFRMADVISTEARAKANLFRARNQRGGNRCLSLWSPNVNMFRDPRWGRGQETFGEDPYLSSVMGCAFVKGIQGDDPKYFKAVACAKHYAVHSGPEKKRHEFNVNLDKRDLYEYYLPAFKALVCDANVESVMGAYSAVNGEPCCANSMLLKDILRKEWGFKGTVVSDVGAVEDISAKHHFKADKVEASLATIAGGLDLCSEGTYHQLRGPMKEGKIKKNLLRDAVINILTTRALLGDLDQNAKTPWDNLGAKDIASPAHKALALEVAEKSLVLVKNNGILPLDMSKINTIGIWGRARDTNVLMGNYNGETDDPVSVLSGFLREVGPDIVVEEGHGGNVTIACLGICPGDEGEEHDRKSLAMWSVLSNQLRSDRQKNPNKKIVGVVFGGSAIDLREAAEFCDALIIAWYPGEQGGRAIARAILGKTNPGGRLPITYCKDPDRLPDFEDYTLPGHSYRYMDSNVLFPFGFGLSYTTFAYSDIRMKKGAGGTVKVGAKVTNTGKVAGDEVVQLYVRSPKSSGDRRRHHLEGFKRIALKPGETKNAVFTLAKEQLMQFGVDGKQTLAKGEYELFIGGGQPGFTDDVLSVKIDM